MTAGEFADWCRMHTCRMRVAYLSHEGELQAEVFTQGWAGMGLVYRQDRVEMQLTYQ